jgi:DNA-binding Lrp family transcriptional regulator
MLAYVFLKVQPGRESDVACEIVKVKEITEAAWTYGFWDILFKVNIGSTEQLNDDVLKKVRKISGVKSTESILVSPTPIYGSRPSADSFRKTKSKRKSSKR